MSNSLRPYLLSCVALCLLTVVQAQQLEIELVEDTLIFSEVHPTDPTIFHFNTFNYGEETIIVDIVKSGASHPDDWDISICTVACLPPETDEAIFPIGGMLEEEVSVYFYPRSVGQGSVDIHMQSQEDSSETYDIRLYVEAVLPTDLEELAPMVESSRKGDTFFFDFAMNCELFIHSNSGQLMEQKSYSSGSQTLDISSYQSGIYTISIRSKGLQKKAWKFYKA